MDTLEMPGRSKEVAQSALRMAMTDNREEEFSLKESMAAQGIHCAASDFGGEFSASIGKIVERSVVSAKREGLIGSTHHEEGAVAGACHEALIQIQSKALGLNVGGKIGIARRGEHLAVAVFFGVGLVHLNEICVGLGHRAV